jgi:hypothetical protein
MRIGHPARIDKCEGYHLLDRAEYKGGLLEDIQNEAQPTNPDLPERCTNIALFHIYLFKSVF